ncbi:hypothetical protein ACA910_014954 [Epithemia clementina (nom. ined.)]
MEIWASKYGSKAQFLCCSVDGLLVAQMFDRMFQFKDAFNAYIPNWSYFPVVFGQLGCSGFIISDPKGRFVSRKTLAFLEHEEEAFRDVERILEPYIDRRTMQEGTEHTDKAEEEETFTPSWTSVGIGSMDHEHQECAEVLETLLRHPTTANLRTVLDHLRDHFQHEERLMTQHQFGGHLSDPFSAISSHVKDHQLLTSIAEDELNHLSNNPTPCGLGTV